MRITIIGGGKIGYQIAENLAKEDHDITVIDTDQATIDKINEELDVLCIKGNGASEATLRDANIQNTDIFIATTNRDEVNMIACLAGKSLGAKYTIARIRDYEYDNEQEFLTKSLKIDLAINPEATTAAQLSRLMRYAAAGDVETFCNGRVELVSFRASGDDFIVGKPLYTLRNKLSSRAMLFCAVEREGETFIPNGSTVINAGDRVYMIGTPPAINGFLRDLGKNTEKIKNALIVGGGRVCNYLTSQLIALGINVKIIENDYDRCVELTEMFPKAIVIVGDGTDQDLLELEDFTEYDCFLTLTGRDEDNIITALYAKQHGLKKVITKVNRQNYMDIVDSLEIDSVVSPKLTTAYGIIRTVRGMVNSQGSKMQALYNIAGSSAEAMEFVVSGTTRNLGTPIKSLKLKKGILLAVILRKGKVIIPEGDDYILENDNLIIVSGNHQIGDINDIFAD